MFHVLHRAAVAEGCHTRCMRARVALRNLRLAWLVLGVATALLPVHAAAAAPHIEQADLNGDINTITASYIGASVSRAEADHADALLVILNTPGGISNSMDDIVTSLVNSTVPVIVFVYPSGARAASAGLFVAQAADVEATDIGSLLSQVDGRSVPRANGSLVIHSAGAVISDNPMPFWQVFLNALTDPTIAALLIIVAGYGIITELSNPGLILPGVVGGIAAVLAIVSLANLPVNIAAALLMLLALLLFIADLKAPTHGFLSVGGVFALLLGMAFLINTGPIGLGVNPIVSIALAAVTLGFFAFFIRKVLAARRQPAFVGGDSLVGALGEAREELAPEGLVFVSGALWKAKAASPIPAGTAVRVVGRDGLELQVARENGQAENGQAKERK